jgi:hypothetical protein
MGIDALRSNGITRKILYFFQDKVLTPADEPLRKVRKSRILLFIGVQLIGFGATFATTQTIGIPPFLHLVILSHQHPPLSVQQLRLGSRL